MSRLHGFGRAVLSAPVALVALVTGPRPPAPPPLQPGVWTRITEPTGRLHITVAIGTGCEPLP